MEKLSIYEFRDYKNFVVQWMERMPNSGRGQRKILADAVGCQTPFITHVLSGEYNFSLEQAEGCARFMGLSEAEAEFFLLLVIKHRAGTKALENLANRQITQRREAQTVLKKRVGVKERMRLEDQLRYYSSWHYAAIHIACLIPQLTNVEALQKYFRLPLQQILSTLEFLTEHGFIEATRTGYRV